MKRLIIALATSALSQTAFSWDNIPDTQIVRDGDIVISSDEISMKSPRTYLENYKNQGPIWNYIPLEINKDGKIVGTIGQSHSYKKGEILKNGQKAINKKMVLAETISSAKESCLNNGGTVLTIGKQESDSYRSRDGAHGVYYGPSYRVYSGYSLITCDLSSKAADIIIEIDKAFIGIDDDIARLEKKLKKYETEGFPSWDPKEEVQQSIKYNIEGKEKLLKIRTILLNQ